MNDISNYPLGKKYIDILIELSNNINLIDWFENTSFSKPYPIFNLSSNIILVKKKLIFDDAIDLTFVDCIFKYKKLHLPVMVYRRIYIKDLTLVYDVTYQHEKEDLEYFTPTVAKALYKGFEQLEEFLIKLKDRNTI